MSSFSVWPALVGLGEQLHAVGADDPYFLGAANDGPALGAYPPPGAALGSGRSGGSCLTAARCFAAVACPGHVGPRQPFAHLDGLPALVYDKFQQCFRRACDGPAVLLVMRNFQPVGLCLHFEAAVVVDAIIRGVFDAVLQAVLVHHLMQQGGSGVLNGAVQRGRRNIDLVLAFLSRLPDLGAGDVAVSRRRFLQADDGFRELSLEIVLVEHAEHLLKLSSGATGFHGLLHGGFSPLYVKIEKWRDRWYNDSIPAGCSCQAARWLQVGEFEDGMAHGDGPPVLRVNV